MIEGEITLTCMLSHCLAVFEFQTGYQRLATPCWKPLHQPICKMIPSFFNKKPVNSLFWISYVLYISLQRSLQNSNSKSEKNVKLKKEISFNKFCLLVNTAFQQKCACVCSVVLFTFEHVKHSIKRYMFTRLHKTKCMQCLYVVCKVRVYGYSMHPMINFGMYHTNDLDLLCIFLAFVFSLFFASLLKLVNTVPYTFLLSFWIYFYFNHFICTFETC